MKRKLYLLVVPILGLNLYWFFSFYNASFKTPKEEKRLTVISEQNEKKNVDIEDYIIGVVACEMPALYEEEALKAQAIASRTYAYYMLEHNKDTVLTDTTDQCFIDQTSMKDKWGNKYEEYYNKIKNIVNSTSKKVMQKDNKLFKSFYFSTSNGNTLDSIAVFKEGDIKSVSSSWDKESKDYEETITISKDKLNKILGNFEKINITKRDSTNHILEVKVDNKAYTGIEFRKLLNLRSTDFIIKENQDNYEFTTYGYGHGVGMSQYGANYLAKSGKSSEEILKYYYNDITFANY